MPHAPSPFFAAVEPAVRTAIRRCARHGPSEWLPKEELIRCAAYGALAPRCAVFVEPPYYTDKGPPDDEIGREEYDLWCAPAKRLWGGTWVEIKRGWSVAGFNNKPTEQLLSWERDLEKLGRAPGASKGAAACFVLIAFADRFHVDRFSKQVDALDEYLGARGVIARREDGRWWPIVWKPEVGPLVARLSTWTWGGSFAHR